MYILFSRESEHHRLASSAPRMPRKDAGRYGHTLRKGENVPSPLLVWISTPHHCTVSRTAIAGCQKYPAPLARSTQGVEGVEGGRCGASSDRLADEKRTVCELNATDICTAPPASLSVPRREPPASRTSGKAQDSSSTPHLNAHAFEFRKRDPCRRHGARLVVIHILGGCTIQRVRGPQVNTPA